MKAMDLSQRPNPQPCSYCGQTFKGDGKYCCHACRTLHEIGMKPAQIPLLVAPAWQGWDDEALAREYNHAASEDRRRFVFDVEGLQCASCVLLLEQLPRWNAKVLNAQVDWGTQRITIEAEAGLTVGVAGSLIQNLGYNSRPVHPHQEGDDENRAGRGDLLRLGVAGFCAGNLMLFSIPLYAGAAGVYQTVFAYISAVLFLPVLFYSARPLLVNSWNSLRVGHWSTDLPLAIALISTSALSYRNVWAGNDHFYFDSTAGFIFLILLVRHWHRKAMAQALRGGSLLKRIFSDVVTLATADGERAVSVHTIEPGQVLVLPAETVLPCDALLQDDRAAFDTSYVDGESVPRWFQRGQKISAGYRLRSPKAIRLEAVQKFEDGDLVQALKKISATTTKAAPVFRYEKSARRLVLIVTGVAALLLAYGLFRGNADYVQRALALMIVACPCALMIGGPAIYAAALKKAQSRGLIVKSAEVLDRVRECRHLILDKTGTVTTGDLQLVEQHPAQMPDWIPGLILSLEAPSQHPVAFAFRRLYKDLSPNPEVTDVEEIIGEEVRGHWKGSTYRLIAIPETRLGLKIALFREKQLIADFVFEDSLQDFAPQLIQVLKPRLQIGLCSGDSHERVLRIAERLGISEVVSSCKPNEKRLLVEQTPNALMVGDGFNDAAALQAAHVGLAVGGAVELSLQKASAYALRPGLRPVYDLLQISDQTHRALKRNMALALAYNISAGLLAIAGYINPLAGAVLMPLSSGLILFSTWRFYKEPLP